MQNIEKKSCKNLQQEVLQKRSAVSFEEISCDQSEGNVSSHNRLVTYINKFGQDAFQRIYTKQELTRLCGAFGVETTSQTNKTTMATALVPVIRSCSSVPNPYVLDNYRILANTDDNARRVVLRIARLHLVHRSFKLFFSHTNSNITLGPPVVSVTVLTLCEAPPKMFYNWYRI